MEKLQNYKGLFFDCDNTIAFTMQAHCEAYKYVFNHFGLTLSDEEFYLYAPEGGKNLIKHTVLDKGYDMDPKLIIDLKSELIDSFLDKYMVPNKKLIELIKNKKNTKIIVVSNGRKHSIQTIIKKLGIEEYIDYLITADDVTHSKPNPDPYLQALKISGLNKEDCVVFEDNEIGITAAKSAGLSYIQVEYNEGEWK